MWSSDFARVYSTGNPTENQKRAYRDLKEIQEATIRFVRPGVSAEEIFHAAGSAYRKRGRPFSMPLVGHGFGLELHEYPLLRPGNQRLIEKGMVLNIGPMLKDEDGGVYDLEDSVLVTGTGTRVLTLGLAPLEIPILGN